MAYQNGRPSIFCFRGYSRRTGVRRRTHIGRWLVPAATVNTGAFGYNRPYQEKAIPSLRFIADLANLDNSVFVMPPGQSGQPFTKHFSDQAQMWLEGRYHPMPFSAAAVDRFAAGRLDLLPDK